MTRVLVAGAAGFVAGHLIEHLQAGGHDLVGLDRRPLEAPSIDFVHVDLLHSEESRDLQRVLADVTHVVHLAAEAYVPDSVPDPLRYVDNNVVATARFINALRKGSSRLQRFIMVSSCEVYGSTVDPVDESGPIAPASPYAATKLAQETFAQAAQRCYGLPVTTVRLFNNYGPRQQSTRLIPSIIRSASRGEAFKMSDEGKQTRDWIDVRDTVAGLALLLTADDVDGEVFNVCAETELSVHQVVDRAFASLSDPPDIVTFPGIRGALTRSAGLGQKLRDATGWTPRRAIDEFLSEVMADIRGPVHSPA